MPLLMQSGQDSMCMSLCAADYAGHWEDGWLFAVHQILQSHGCRPAEALCPERWMVGFFLCRCYLLR